MKQLTSDDIGKAKAWVQEVTWLPATKDLIPLLTLNPFLDVQYGGLQRCPHGPNLLG
jgi:hypothetical protein